MTKRTEFDAVYAALRGILLRRAGTLTIVEDSPRRFCLQGGVHPQHKTPMPIAWVQMGKAYVSFHHMGIYARPALLKAASEQLKARMHGKSCFNFTAVNEVLFAELEDLTVRAFSAFKDLGYIK